MLKAKNIIFSIAVFALIVCFAINAQKYAAVTLDGITLWALNLVPSVFPYFVFTALLTNLGIVTLLSLKTAPLTRRIFGCNGLSGYAFFMSVLSGYPTGSKITAELYENKLITYEEAVKTSGFCSTSGPLFIIGTIGGLLNNAKTATVILIAHLSSVLITAFIFKGKTPPKTKQNFPLKNVDNIIYNAVYDSVISLFILGGVITVYYVITEMLFDTGLLTLPLLAFEKILGSKEVAKAFITGIFECTKGIKAITLARSNLTVPLIGFLISFGGLSVITQSVIFLKKAKIKTAVFFASKIIQAVLCFLILYITSLIGLV